MFATGFCMDVEEIADQDAEVLNWMTSLAVNNNIAVGGSVAVKENGKFYNRFYFIEKTELYTITIKDIFFLCKRRSVLYAGNRKSSYRIYRLENMFTGLL